MGKITNSSSLDLSNKGLTEIPQYVFCCKNLKSLNLSNNKLKEIPVGLSYMMTLKKLDLSNNSIKQVLSKTFTLANLEVLNLNNNAIKSLPKQLGNLKKLKSLQISGNELEFLPEEITEIKGLRIINVSNNKFTIFPEQLLRLPELVRLWIGKNEFHSIPIITLSENLTKLKAIYSFNPILNSYEVDRPTVLLGKQKGNALRDLKLMTYKSTSTDSKKSISKHSQTSSKTIFISYSHNDEIYKDEVLKTLKGLQNVFPELAFDVWSDDRIRTGQKWLKEIEDSLDKAGIAILIVSRDFISSEFIMKEEVPTILRNAEKNGTIIMNLIAGKSLFKNLIISQFQCVNRPNEPLKSLSEHQQDVVYTKLAEDVKLYLSL